MSWQALSETSVFAASSLTLVWSPSADANVAGYKIYYGTTSHEYTKVLVFGNVTNAIIPNISPGTPYYFAATTFTTSGAESLQSPEVTYTVPALANPAYSPNQLSFQVAGTAGSSFVVEASSDLINWYVVQTNTAPFTFVDTNLPDSGTRFYRTYLIQ